MDLVDRSEYEGREKLGIGFERGDIPVSALTDAMRLISGVLGYDERLLEKCAILIRKKCYGDLRKKVGKTLSL